MVDWIFFTGCYAHGYNRNDVSTAVLLFFPVACHGEKQATGRDLIRIFMLYGDIQRLPGA